MKYLSVLMSLFFVFSSSLYAVSEIFDVACSANHQERAAISGRYVVWQDNSLGKSNIKYKNLSENVEFYASFDGLVSQQNPDTDGDIIVWEEDANIIGYDIETNTRFDICVDSNIQNNPLISGNFVIWGENSAIYGCNLADLTKFRVSDRTNPQYGHDIDGNVVVWYEDNFGVMDIYGKNIVTGQEYTICAAQNEQFSPRISGNIVIWLDYRDYSNNSDIFAYNISTGVEFPVCVASGQQSNCDIDGNCIVWQDSDIIYYRDLSENGSPTHQITSSYSIDPAVSNHTVVWTVGGSSNKDVKGCYLPSLTTVSLNSPVQGQMLSSDKLFRIQWDCSPQGSGLVKLEYSTDLGQSFDEIVITSSEKGFYDWVVPSAVDSNQCSIRVSDPAESTVLDTVGPIIIASCDIELTADVDGNCVIDMADFAALASQWQKCGNPYDSNCID